MAPILHFDEAIPFVVPLNGRFRGVTEREGVLLRIGRNWGEWAPFTEYDDEIAARWLRAAFEAASGDWPMPVRDSVGDIPRHAGLRNAAQQHACRVEPRNAHILQQPAIDEKRERDARVHRKLIRDHHADVVGVSHHVCTDEKLDDRHHQRINQVGDEQHPHVPRVGEK